MTRIETNTWPNELPEGGEGGGGGSYRYRRIWGELPPPSLRENRINSVLVAQIVQLRNRLNQIETAQFLGAFSGRASYERFGDPAELPEGGEGGGTIGWRWPWPWPPGEGPEELQPGPTFVDIDARFTAIENHLVQLGEQIANLAQGD